MGLKAVAAAKAASAAAKQAAAQALSVLVVSDVVSLPLSPAITAFTKWSFCPTSYREAIAMAQNTNLAALQAEQAQAMECVQTVQQWPFLLGFPAAGKSRKICLWSSCIIDSAIRVCA